MSSLPFTAAPVAAYYNRPLVQGRGVTCEIIRDFDQLETIAGDWQRLWESDSSTEFFQSFAWARAWWGAFGDEFRLCVATVFQDGEAAFILPLVQKGHTLSFLGSPQLDYADAICSGEHTVERLALCLRTLLRDLPDWRECVLDHLRPDSHIVKCWNELPSDLRRRMHLDISYGCPTIDFNNKKDEVLDPLLMGKHLRRRFNKLNKAGDLTFRHIENRTEAQRQLALFFRSHRRRCAALAKESCFDNGSMRLMMHALVGQIDLRKELRFGVLELNGRPLAWSFGFHSHGKYSYYQQTFDIDAEEYAPGEVLLRFLLLYSKENVEREFDFLRGDEFFKKRYATKIQQCHRLFVERSGLLGHALRLIRALQGRVRRAESVIENYVRARENVFRYFRAYLIWKRDLSRRLQWARENRGTTKYVLHESAAFIQQKLWAKNLTTVFRARGTASPQASVADPQTAIMKGQLGDLADLALEHPEISFPDFREYRNRFKRGDEVYMVCLRGELNLVAWTRVAGSDQAGSPSRLSLYECWPIGDATEACARLLPELAEKALRGNLDLMVTCSALPIGCRNAICQQQFAPQCEIEARSFLGAGPLARVRKCATSTEELDPDAKVCPKFHEASACGVATATGQTGEYGARN